MSAESDLYTILSSDAGVAALVADRIHMQVMPEGEQYPAVVYSRGDEDPTYTIHGARVCSDVDIDIQVWARSPDQARAVMAAIDAALIVSGLSPDGGPTDYDDTMDLYSAETTVTITEQ